MSETFAVTEVRAALTEVTDSLNSVARLVLRARGDVLEATAMLTELGRTHHESLVPLDLLRAEAELARGLQLLAAGAAAVAAVDARL